MAMCDNRLDLLWNKAEKYSNKIDDKIIILIKEAINNYSPLEEIQKLKKYDIGYITFRDKCYPSLLKEIPDFPAIIYAKGNIGALNFPSISIIGSRKFTIYGKRVCYNLARKCSEAGLSIVSGLALGIDSIAHLAAVDNSSVTVGVLGCGLDHVYPETNRQLAGRIIQNGGVIISEYPPGTPPYKANFPARNRIIAGLSRGTLVVEAAPKSGALITAYLALEYNRDVFAVPGNIDSESSLGTNQLIKEGAKLVSSSEDILNEFNITVINDQEKMKQNLPLSNEEKIIIDILNVGEKNIDEIVAESKLSIIEINVSLTMMEMKGMVENIGGGMYKKI